MVLDNITKVERGKNVRLNILVYGLMDAGKTVLLGSAQRCNVTSPSLLLDVDGGTQSLVGNDIDIFRPQSFSEIQEVYDFLRYENKTYKSVGIDSITEIQRKLSMGEIIGTLTEDSGYDNLPNTRLRAGMIGCRAENKCVGSSEHSENWRTCQIERNAFMLSSVRLKSMMKTGASFALPCLVF